MCLCSSLHSPSYHLNVTLRFSPEYLKRGIEPQNTGSGKALLERTIKLISLMLTMAPFFVTNPSQLAEMGREWEFPEQIKTPLGCKNISSGRAFRSTELRQAGRDSGHVSDGALLSRAVRTQLCVAINHSSDPAEKPVSSASRPPASLSGRRLTARGSGAAAGSQPELWCLGVGQMERKGGPWALKPHDLCRGHQFSKRAGLSISLIKMEVDVLYC